MNSQLVLVSVNKCLYGFYWSAFAKGVKGAIDLVDYSDCKASLNINYKLLVLVLLLVSIFSVSVSVFAETDYSTNFALNETNESSDSQIDSPETSISSSSDLLIDLQYKSSTDYDLDDDGIEDKETGIVDLTVEDTGFVGDVDQNKLCTRWEVYSKEDEKTTSVCYGAEQCCGFIDLLATTASWDQEFQLHYGRFGATENNDVTAQVIHVDYDLSTDYYDIFYSSRQTLSVKFLDLSNWRLEVYTNKEYYKPNEVVRFYLENSIEEADVQMSINDRTNVYNVIYTPGQAVEFTPTTPGEYAAVATATLGENVKTKIFEFTVSEEAVSSPSFSRDKLYIARQEYHLGETVELVLDVENMRSADLEIISSDTLYQYNDVGELFEFVPPDASQYFVTATVLTPDGEKEFKKNFTVGTGPMRVNLELENSLLFGIDPVGMELYETGTKADLGVPGNRLDMEYGKRYDLLIKLREETIINQTNQTDVEGNLTNGTNTTNATENIQTDDDLFSSQALSHPIKSILIRGLRAESADALKLRIDENINDYKYNFTQLYAIDPSDMLFDNATVTVTAQGSVLYKCKDWDFITQTCTNDVWTLYKTGLVPGEEYEILITPDDPGFGEGTGNESFGSQAINVTNHTIAGFNILREQPDGIGTDRETEVGIVLWYEAEENSTIYNISLREELPAGWEISAAPANSTVLNDSLIVKVSNLTAGSYYLVTYKVKSPSIEGESAFNADLIYNFNDSWYNTTTIDYNVRVNDSKAFFDVKTKVVPTGYLAELNETVDERKVDSSGQTVVVFNVSNIGNSGIPANYPAIFKWKYNDSMFYVADINGDCSNGVVVDWEGEKAIECIWATFAVNETKVFNATVYALGNGTVATKFNITYDPPLIKSAEMNEILNKTDEVFMHDLTGKSIIDETIEDSALKLTKAHLNNYVAKDIRLFASGVYRLLRWFLSSVLTSSEDGFDTLSRIMSGDLSPITGVPIKEKKPEPAAPKPVEIVAHEEVPVGQVEVTPSEEEFVAEETPSEPAPEPAPEEYTESVPLSQRISELPQATKGKRNYPEPIEEPAPAPIQPAAVWISTTEEAMLKADGSPFAIYLAPDDPETAQFVAEGSVTPILREGKVDKVDQSVLFNHPAAGRSMGLRGMFSAGIVDLRNLKIRKDHESGKVAVDFRDVYGVEPEHTIYLENTKNTGVYICPDAYELSDVYYNCPGMLVFDPEEISDGVSKDGISVSVDGDYYVIHGVTGTGAGQLVILNVKSYPVLWGNWTVEFNTTGTEDLVITAINGTTWTNWTNSSSYDLKFLKLKCGNASLDYTFVDNSTDNCTTSGSCYVYYANYSCNNITSYEVSQVLTPGDHYLKFQFGNAVEYAENVVGKTDSLGYGKGPKITWTGDMERFKYGDINGDGYEDLVIGNGQNSVFGAQSGKIFIFYGPFNRTSYTVTTDYNASIYGACNSTFFGNYFDVVDVNNDSKDDIISGSGNPPCLSGGTLLGLTGEAYLHYGGDWFGDYNVSTSANLTWTAEHAGTSGEDRLGSWGGVSAGDVNADGYNDFLLDAWDYLWSQNLSYGKVFLIYGGPNLQGGNVSQVANASFYGEGYWNQLAHYGYESGGDFNGDGHDDLVLHAAWNDSVTRSGKKYMIFGKNWTGTHNVSDVVNISWHGNYTAGLPNVSVTRQMHFKEDLNNDGKTDLLLRFANTSAASLYITPIIYGNASLSGDFDARSGGAYDTYFYGSVAVNSESLAEDISAGDYNNDTVPEVMIGSGLVSTVPGEVRIWAGRNFSGPYFTTTANKTWTGASYPFGRLGTQIEYGSNLINDSISIQEMLVEDQGLDKIYLFYNTRPVGENLSVNTTSGTNYSDEDIDCWIDAYDAEEIWYQADYEWYNGSNLYSSGTKQFNVAGDPFNSITESVNTLSSSVTASGETWWCRARLTDGLLYSEWQNSTNLTIVNKVPTHDNPTLTSDRELNYTTENLFCNPVNVADADGDLVTNITDWYRNDKSWNVLKMPFDVDNSSLAKDLSPFGNDGVVRNGAAWTSSGISGGAYDFDGSNDFINVSNPTDGSLDFPGGNFSLEVWFKTSSTIGAIDQNLITKYDGGNNYGYVLFVGGSTNSGLLNLVVGGTGGFVLFNTVGTDYRDGAWHHAVATYSSTAGSKIYVDSALEASNTTTVGDLTAAYPLYVGTGVAASSDFFNGTIDEVRVYNTTLTDTQIYTNYNSGVPRYDKLVSDETSAGDIWRCNLTVADRYAYGDSLVSNNLTIRQDQSNLSCIVRQTSCEADEVEVMGMSNQTNAHAELVNMSTYDWQVCCKDISGYRNLTNSSGNNLVNLSNYTNAHVEIPGTTDYAYGIYLGMINQTGVERWGIDCDYRNVSANCPSNETCVFTISDTTNAHASDCSVDPYNTTICCAFDFINTAPSTTVILNSTNPSDAGQYPGSSDNLTCYANVTDADGDNTTVFYRWYNNSVLVPGLSGNVSDVQAGVATLISTLGSGNTSEAETWTCAAHADDSYENETSWKNDSITIGIDCGFNDWQADTSYFVGNDQSTGGVCWNVDNTQNISIDCRHHDINGGTYAVYAPNSGTPSKNLTIANCRFHDFSSAGAYRYFYDARFYNNTINGTSSGTNYGIYIYTASGTFGLGADIDSNNISDYYYGIFHYYADNTNVTNNRFDQIRAHSLYVTNTAQYMDIINNTFNVSSTASQTVYIQSNSDYCDIKDNTFVDGGSTAGNTIYLYNDLNDCEVTGNYFNNTGGRLSIDGSSHNVSNNQIFDSRYSSTSAGTIYVLSQYSTFDNNTIDGSATHGFYIQDQYNNF
ncbi:hypothetical protein GF371_05565, partial [Candidatus Woesearchaeota archaeon]|nr:hypothetical protein [Candidatus Woesearchaeota archaeon]